MAKAFTPKVVTANHLLDGDVIYMNANREWVLSLLDAHLLTDEATANEWLTAAEEQVWIVVGAYLADAIASDGGPKPTHIREEFRRTGPSNYAHGKQVELSSAQNTSVAA